MEEPAPGPPLQRQALSQASDSAQLMPRRPGEVIFLVLSSCLFAPPPWPPLQLLWSPGAAMVAGRGQANPAGILACHQQSHDARVAGPGPAQDLPVPGQDMECSPKALVPPQPCSPEVVLHGLLLGVSREARDEQGPPHLPEKRPRERSQRGKPVCRQAPLCSPVPASPKNTVGAREARVPSGRLAKAGQLSFPRNRLADCTKSTLPQQSCEPPLHDKTGRRNPERVSDSNVVIQQVRGEPKPGTTHRHSCAPI